MPRYDYRCKECGNQFELRQSFHSEPVADCPDCGSPSNRKIHAPPVIFKGSGWYVTDYGKGRGNNGMNADKPESESSDAKESAGKSESSKSSASAKKEDGGTTKASSASAATNKGD